MTTPWKHHKYAALGALRPNNDNPQIEIPDMADYSAGNSALK
jgi:hypothetical protein